MSTQRTKIVASLLPADWPAWAVSIVADEAIDFHRACEGDWAVPEVLLERSVDRVSRAIERALRDGEDADDAWVDRWEDAKTDVEVADALTKTSLELSKDA